MYFKHPRTLGDRLNTPRIASQPAALIWVITLVPRRLHRAAQARVIKEKKEVFFAREESSLIAPKHGKSRKRSRINLFHCCVSLKRNLDFVSLHWKLKQIVGNLFWKKKVVEFGKEKLFLFNIGREEFLLTRQDLSKFWYFVNSRLSWEDCEGWTVAVVVWVRRSRPI